uniref:Coiled-coil domain-containing protein 30 n=2 Tax=Callorhinchus milii TaxID=7868 RepID=A0A4W3JVS4_CALMI
MSEACSKVEGSQNKLTCVVKENQQLLQENGALRQQICSLQQECKLLTQENTDLRQKFCNYQVETSHLHQDNASFRQQLVCSQQENQRLNQELCNIQKQLGGQMLCKEDNNNQMELQSLRKKVARLQCALEFEQQKACQERLALEMQLEEANNRTKVGVDLKAIQDKICAQERENKALRCEIEEKQEKIKGLELEAAKSCQLSKQLKCLHDELASEKCRVQAAEKKFAEMQQHLNSCQHQVRLAETRIKEKEIMEAELNDKRDLVCMLRNELQEELLQRKLAEQCADDLHHQLKTMQDKETCQARMVADLQHCLHEQQARVRALEEEKTSISNENECQQRVRKQQTEELLATQQELEKHKEELRSVLQQLDSHVRLHNDKQIKHKMKLRKAKEIFIREVMARDGKVKQLENEVKLMRNLLDKEHTWNMKITCENDLLLAEKRDLLQKLNEQEELVRNNSSIACGVKQRINYLEDENKQLQDETVTLSSRLGSLERTLKNIQSIRALEDLKRTLSNENLLSKCLPSSLASDFPGGSGTDSVLDCIRRVKLNEPADCMKFSYLGSSRVPYSDIGYLNVSGSSAGVRFREQEDRHSLCSDEV